MVVEEFEYHGRKCVILFNPKGGFNGYVESKFERDYDIYNDAGIWNTEEATFAGIITNFINNGKNIPEGWFIGFDTLHFWDDRNPESCTLKAVKKRLKDFCKEIVKIDEEEENEN